jgi:membrane associated rhomboid family serine protease
LPISLQLAQTGGMRGRYPGPSGISYQFGPGPWTPAIKAIIIANGLVFIVTFFQPILLRELGVTPSHLFENFAVWELVTYMFVHGGPSHLLFNMLTLYLMGVELERMWGTRYFTKFYFACGIGAGVTQVLLGLLPGGIGDQFYYTSTIGASGAIFGILLAYALYFPNRPILMFFLFPVPAKYFVMIIGALAFMFSPGSGVSNSAHLGGLLFGYLYLKNRGGGLTAEFKYRYLKWKMNRLRRRFDVHAGGRSDWDRKVH